MSSFGIIYGSVKQVLSITLRRGTKTAISQDIMWFVSSGDLNPYLCHWFRYYL